MTRVPPRVPRARGLAGLAVLSAVLLSGCGSVSGWNPGVAARVGDQTVSDSTVRQVSADYCSASESLQTGTAVAGSQINAQVAGSLAARAAAEQFLEANDAAVDASYDQSIQQGLKNIDAQYPDLSDAQRDAIVEVEGASLYVSSAELAVGQELAGSGASDDQATAAGKKAFTTWMDDNDVVINPRYAVAIPDGQLAIADTDLSVAVSDVAVQAGSTDSDSGSAEALPESQRCG